MDYARQARKARLFAAMARKIAHKYDDAQCMYDAYNRDSERYPDGLKIAGDLHHEALRLRLRALRLRNGAFFLSGSKRRFGA